MHTAIEVNPRELEELCRRWQVAELALFGSATTDSFRADSDVDLLVTFLPGAEWGLFDHAAMQAELEQMFGRPVDLVSRKSVERSRNWIRREAILSSAEPIYAAR